MDNWYMVALVGKDQSGIVAAVTKRLYESNCNLGEASMVQLGDYFTIMLLVNTEVSEQELQENLRPICEGMQLSVDVYPAQKRQHEVVAPDYRITIYGADRAGIVAQATQELADIGFNIIDLETAVGGSDEKPIYILQIEGTCTKSEDDVIKTLEPFKREGIDVHVETVDLVVA